MKFALLSDIHGNLEALQSVVNDLSVEKADGIYCLGDIVGYGADPGQCIEIIQDLTSWIVAGNHDWAAAGITDTTYFNPVAKSAIEWTTEKLITSHRSFLAKLPLTYDLPQMKLVHATPYEPETWHYIFSRREALRSFQHYEQQICFIGHSHTPVIFVKDKEDEISLLPEDSFTLEDNYRYLINVGSVGQPRDGDPRAAYGIYDTEDNRFTLKRISYNIEAAQEKILEAGLPYFLATRLAEGR